MYSLKELSWDEIKLQAESWKQLEKGEKSRDRTFVYASQHMSKSVYNIDEYGNKHIQVLFKFTMTESYYKKNIKNMLNNLIGSCKHKDCEVSTSELSKIYPLDSFNDVFLDGDSPIKIPVGNILYIGHMSLGRGKNIFTYFSKRLETSLQRLVLLKKININENQNKQIVQKIQESYQNMVI